eukprot:247020_1
MIMSIMLPYPINECQTLNLMVCIMVLLLQHEQNVIERQDIEYPIHKHHILTNEDSIKQTDGEKDEYRVSRIHDCYKIIGVSKPNNYYITTFSNRHISHIFISTIAKKHCCIVVSQCEKLVNAQTNKTKYTAKWSRHKRVRVYA